MQKIKGIKWGLLAAMLVVALGLFTACATRNTPNEAKGTHVIEGYIVDFNNNRVTVDEVEFLTTGSTSRINELGLDTTRDFVNGYYVHDESRTDRKTYTLANNVQVRFGDTANGWYNGAERNAAINNVGGYRANTGVNRNVNVNMGVDSTLPKADVGTVNPIMHVGYSLGGTVGGTLGGVEMLSNRFRNGVNVDSTVPYFITIKDGYVTNIEEASAFSNFAGIGYGNMNNYPGNNYPYDGLYPTTNDNLTTNNYPSTNNYPNTTNNPNTNTVVR